MRSDVFEADLREALARRAAEVPGTAADRLRHGNSRVFAMRSDFMSKCQNSQRRFSSW